MSVRSPSSWKGSEPGSVTMIFISISDTGSNPIASDADTLRYRHQDDYGDDMEFQQARTLRQDLDMYPPAEAGLTFDHTLK